MPQKTTQTPVKQVSSRRERDEAEEFFRQKQQQIDELTRRLSSRREPRRRPGSFSRLPYLIIPAGEVFYASPHIWIETFDNNGNLIPGPRVGYKNIIYARIYNLGEMDAYPTTVNFYWGDPALANQVGGFNTSSTTLIASQYNLNIPASTFYNVADAPYLIVKCEWIPEYVNNGHECIFVDCDNYLDPLQSPFNPVADRHVAQRNVTVIAVEAGEEVQFSLDINNLFPFHFYTTVYTRIERLTATKEASRLKFNDLIGYVTSYKSELREFSGEQKQSSESDRVRRRIKQRSDEIQAAHVRNLSRYLQKLDKAGGAKIKTRLSDQISFVHQPASGKYLADLLTVMDRFPKEYLSMSENRKIKLHEVVQQPYEQRQLHLELKAPVNAQPGEYIVYHLTQQADWMVVGGYAVVLQVVKKMEGNK